MSAAASFDNEDPSPGGPLAQSPKPPSQNPGEAYNKLRSTAMRTLFELYTTEYKPIIERQYQQTPTLISDGWVCESYAPGKQLPPGRAHNPMYCSH